MTILEKSTWVNRFDGKTYRVIFSGSNSVICRRLSDDTFHKFTIPSPSSPWNFDELIVENVLTYTDYVI